MKLKLIACKVLQREISRICASCENFIDVSYIREDYHNDPKKLHDVLQREIDRIESGIDCYTAGEQNGKFDAILLGYGLCGNALAGITSHKYPIIVPRAHDCMTLLLGDAAHYRKIFDEYAGGICWYTCGKMENCLLPCRKTELHNYKKYMDKYGASNATYLVGREKIALLELKLAAFIDTGVRSNECEALAKDAAEYYGWKFQRFDGDMTLLADFLDGKWDNERFLKILPQNRIAPSYDETVVKAEKSEII